MRATPGFIPVQGNDGSDSAAAAATGARRVYACWQPRAGWGATSTAPAKGSPRGAPGTAAGQPQGPHAPAGGPHEDAQGASHVDQRTDIASVLQQANWASRYGDIYFLSKTTETRP